MSNALNLQQINQEEALNLTKFFIKTGQNVAMFGASGTGKTSICHQAADDCGFKVNYINLSVIERPDLAGYPDLSSKGDIINFKSPHFLPKLEEGKKPNSIILFDEVDKAPPEATAPLLEILDKKSINGKPLNIVSCLLTGNLNTERAYSNMVSSAILDRCAKYQLSFNFEKWLDWAKNNQVHELILGFLASNPEFACPEADELAYASPSPRGWTLASKALLQARATKILDVGTIVSVVSGFVGHLAGLRFQVWYEYYRKFEPTIISLIETGTSSLFNYQELQPTEKLIFCISLCHLTKLRFIQDSKNKPNYNSIKNLCSFIIKNNVDPEFQTLSLGNSFPIDFIADKKYQLYNCKQFLEISSKLSEIKIL